MDSAELNYNQVYALSIHVSRCLTYLKQLLQRMDALQFPDNDPLRRAVAAALEHNEMLLELLAEQAANDRQPIRAEAERGCTSERKPTLAGLFRARVEWGDEQAVTTASNVPVHSAATNVSDARLCDFCRHYRPIDATPELSF